MRIIENKILPTKGFSAMMLFGMIFTRNKQRVLAKTVRHESIHAKQMWEMLIVGFYLWYFVEWLVRLLMSGNAYRSISFEREAYANENNVDYLKERKSWSWMAYL
ncbi:hypothetical protein FACS1894199_18800 [Bacteroidia bacterium]|nr:hypothetical protein FACS1894199_18800 [Bacteroidia bacterium]